VLRLMTGASKSTPRWLSVGNPEVDTNAKPMAARIRLCGRRSGIVRTSACVAEVGGQVHAALVVGARRPFDERIVCGTSVLPDLD